MLQLALAALADKPDGLSTREIGVAVLAARQFDHEDPVLLRAMVGLLSNTLKKAVRRGVVAKVGDGRKVAWRIAEPRFAKVSYPHLS